MSQKVIRRILAALMAIVGLAFLVYGLQLSNANPSNLEHDDVAWRVLVVGSAMIGAGICLTLIRARLILLVELALPPIFFSMLMGLFWGPLIFRAMIEY